MVSVVITAYNVQPFIAQAIESVLGQTYKDIECVIVEDCSTDDTIAEIKRASIGNCEPEELRKMQIRKNRPRRNWFTKG